MKQTKTIVLSFHGLMLAAQLLVAFWVFTLCSMHGLFF